MAKNGILVLGFILFFFRFGSATYCSDNSDCEQSQWSSETCCTDGVCRRNCYYCSYSFQCGTGETCCGSKCLSSCPTTSPSTRTTRATYCSYSSDCDLWPSETCCSDGVCRRKCSYCSYDYQCGLGEKCCDGDCLSSCPTTSFWTFPTLAPFSPLTYATLATVAPTSYCTFDSDCEFDDVCCDGDCLTVCPSSSWSGASIVGTVFGTIVFFAFIFSFVSCYFCAWCPYYRYRSPGAVIISGQVPYQPFVTTTQTTMTQNVPPPPNYAYNQPPPPGCQPPPPYSSYPQQLAQHPPAATASGQPPMAPQVTA